MARIIAMAVSALLSFMSALWTWYAVVQGTVQESAHAFLIPGIAVSIMAVFLIVSLILADHLWYSVAIAVPVFSGVLLFAQSWVVVVVVVIGVIGTVSIWRSMQASMRDHVHIRIATHVQSGIGRLILILALTISALFYAIVLTRDAASLMLSQSLHATATGPIARIILPAPLAQGSGANGEATVDDFIAYIMRNQSTSGDNQKIAVQFLENYAGAVSERIKDIVPQRTQNAIAEERISQAALVQARRTLAQELGMPLTGKELVADVFVQSLEREVQIFAERKLLPQGYKFSKALAGIIALFLFLTLLWIGTFVKVVWIFVVQMIFIALVRSGIVRITHVSVQQERIA